MTAYICISHLCIQTVIYILVSPILCPYGTNSPRTFTTVYPFLFLNPSLIIFTEGGHYSPVNNVLGGQYSPVGQYSLVNNVLGDIWGGGGGETLYTMTMGLQSIHNQCFHDISASLSKVLFVSFTLLYISHVHSHHLIIFKRNMFCTMAQQKNAIHRSIRYLL